LLIVSQELEAVRHHPLLARHFPEVLPLVAEAMQPYGDVSQYGAVAQVGMYLVVVVMKKQQKHHNEERGPMKC
jgi:hypothetical protein